MADQNDLGTYSKLRNQVLSSVQQAIVKDLVAAIDASSTGIVAAIAAASTAAVTSAAAIVTAIETTFPRINGTFTLSAAATKVVTDTHTTSTSIILLMPTNASAGTLMGSSKSLYVSARSAGASFTVATADTTNAVGTESFSYVMVVPS